MRITIIDYGLSNLLSVQRAFLSFGAEVEITGDKEKIANAEILILPGVGAFKDGMDGLDKLGLIPVIKQKASEGTPIMGICLGMQMLFDESDEFGTHKGLGLISGRVEKIPDVDTDNNPQRVPHVGWNNLYPSNNKQDFTDTMLCDIPVSSEVYFVHSYQAKPTNTENTLANTVVGGRDVCAVAINNNVIGCQFHPEKSGKIGLAILNKFIKDKQ